MGKLSEIMTDHIRANEQRDILSPVVDTESLSDHDRKDHDITTVSLDIIFTRFQTLEEFLLKSCEATL